ncbi:MAG: peptidylprolyl isomerase [Clostridia bacterium]|nr:peptidylprolyl isomerase [Clostridia bacterium]
MRKIIGMTAFAVAILIFMSACSSGISPIKGDEDDKKTVAKVLGEPVYLEEVRFLVKSCKTEMQNSYGDDIWNDGESAEKYRAELEEKVENAMKINPAFLSLCDEYDIDINDKDTKNYVKEYINSFTTEIGGEKEYKKQLKENGVTDSYLRYVIAIEGNREKLRQELCKDGKIDDSDETAREAVYGDEFIRTLHVLVQNDEGESVEDNRKKAEEALEKLDEGEPFNRIIGRYSEDVLMTTTDGYYFMRGEYDKAYEEAAFALSENEYSGIVETKDGFYIIKRLPKDNDYIEKNFQTLKDRYLFVMFERLIEARSGEASVEYTEYGNKLDLLNLG